MKHEYLLNLANAASTASKDPSTKVGCVISRPDGSIASTGYNGFPKGVNDLFMTYNKPLKYSLIRHAERNAISFVKDSDMSGYIMHVTHAPCFECLSESIHNGIREIYYNSSELLVRFSNEHIASIVSMILSSKTRVINLSLNGNLSGSDYIKDILKMYKENDGKYEINHSTYQFLDKNAIAMLIRYLNVGIHILFRFEYISKKQFKKSSINRF